MTVNDDDQQIYQPPQSCDSQEPSLAQQLLQEQSMFGLIVGCLSAGIPSMLLYALLIAMYDLSVFAFVLPGILIGYTARFCGRGIHWHFRLVTGLITFTLLLSVNYILTFPSGLVFSIPSVVLAMILCNRKLTREENAALIQHEVFDK